MSGPAQCLSSHAESAFTRFIEESRPELSLVVEEDIYEQLSNPSDAIVPLRKGSNYLGN